MSATRGAWIGAESSTRSFGLTSRAAMIRIIAALCHEEAAPLDTPHDADPLPPLRRARAFLLALAVVVAAGAVLRAPLVTAWSSSYPLTQVFNGEEVETVRVSTGMLHKRSLNPHQFGYPSLYYYLGLAVVSPIDRAESRSWTGDLLAMRAVSLAFGLGTLVLIGLLGRRLAGDAAGVLAAALAACDRTSIDVSTI